MFFRFFSLISFFLFFELFSAYPFQEVWVYFLKGEEKFLKGGEPITDLVYFSAAVNEVGRIDKVPERIIRTPRVHLSISAPYNRSLMHWVLARDLETRNELIQDIVRATEQYDGVNIDFEGILPQDRNAYLSFLQEIKGKLPKGKIFSVALPARTTERDDAFPYRKISEIADKVFVMAYDQHGRTEKPGEIASLEWSARVGSFAQKTVPSEKLVMGMPLYGRVWQEQAVAQALKYPQTLELLKKFSSAVVKRKNDGTGYFSFQQTVDATVYFEDMQSLGKKLEYYFKDGFKAVGFWRLGQEPAILWKKLHIDKAKHSQ